MNFDISKIDPDKPVLIYGPTATGQSGLALDIAKAQGGVIVNADALQVYQGWPILTAQPPAEDLAQAPHHLYGHLPYDAPYSVGHWLRDVTPFLDAHRNGAPRPIIVGGTGLYFKALTEGLADIPPTPADIREAADRIPLAGLINFLDDDTKANIDLNNRTRVQRAYEVLQTTGFTIRDWQAKTPPPALTLEDCTPLCLVPDVEWLNARIDARYEMMLAAGARSEARDMVPNWDPAAPSSKAIGAAEMIANVTGRLDGDSARAAISLTTRQYAKRQRTWGRSRMKRWLSIPLPDVAQ